MGIVNLPYIIAEGNLLTVASVNNSIKIATSSEGSSCIEQILSLVKRSDAVAIKSEGTRVLVNVVKSLCAHNKATPSADPRYQNAVQLITKPEYSLYLAQLLARSQKYHLLINESLIAMTLVAVHSNGGKQAEFAGYLNTHIQ